MADQVAEQPVAESATVEDRLTALFSNKETAEPEAEKAPEAESKQAESTTDETTEAETTESATEEPFVEVPDDEGVNYKVPAKLKDSFLRQQDYTKKTQEVATVRKAAEDKIQYAEAREQILGAVMQDVLALKETESKFAQLNGLDWAALYNADPGQALNLRNQLDGLKSEVDRQKQVIQQKTSQFEQARKTHTEKQWALAVEGVRQKIGNVTQADDVAMLKTATDLGFTRQEITEKYADPRFLHAMHMAAKYAQLQGQKADAVAAVNKAPPVIKTGASQPGAAADNRYRELRQQFKKSGSIEDATQLLMLRRK